MVFSALIIGSKFGTIGIPLTQDGIVSDKAKDRLHNVSQ